MNGHKATYRGPTLKHRVSQAYHDYGRLCAAHPVFCLSMSILTMLILSQPAISRFQLPASSPIDVHWSENPTVDTKEAAPDWVFDVPAVYLQQIVIKGKVDPWNSLNMTSEQSVRGPLSRAFMARSVILTDEGVDSSCLHVRRPHYSGDVLPRKGCLLLSPTAFWSHMEEKFKQDGDVLDTVFADECTPSLCLRELLLGMPMGMTGIKRQFQTNRKRSIDYILTLFFVRYDSGVREGVRRRLAEKFQLEQSQAADESTFVHVFYRPRKYFSNYFPLFFSYAVFMAYTYYSARKLVMVASKWGLAFAAVFTVATTLMMTTGICAHLDMTPSLWSAEMFPYIALILGLENTLCITKSVVSTSPSMDVSSRIAHGLSQEGYSLFKYFLMELLFLSFAYLTRVSEIQEFCRFAFIGLTVDFYMQLVFYVPCLTLDLSRLGNEEKRKFAMMLFSTEIPQLKHYPPVSCPARRLFPRLFERKRRVKRRLSDSQLDEKEDMLLNARRGHRRSISVSKSDFMKDEDAPTVDASTSIRLKIMYFVTRTRIMQRSIMLVFTIWVIWLAFFVHSQRADSIAHNGTGFGVSHRILETAPQEWGEWQRRTFRWWPALFGEYNISLAGHYITFLPPIVLSTTVDPSDPFLQQVEAPSRSSSADATDSPELRSRIHWLETQLQICLVVFILLLVSSVVGFFLYACFWGRWRNGWKREAIALSVSPNNGQEHCTGRSKAVVESLPIVFAGHRFPIECIAVDGSERIVSSCQEGQVCLRNAQTGERILYLNRLRLAPSTELTEPPPAPPQIWSMAMRDQLVVMGCADGSIEVACLERNKLIGVFQQSRVGIIHVKLMDDIIVVARLDGSVEFVEMALTLEKPIRVNSLRLQHSIRLHQKPISQLMILQTTMILTASHDHTLKLWNTEERRVAHTLHAHNAAVTTVALDREEKMLLSACEEGVICWWNVETGELIRSVHVDTAGPVQLACTTELVLAYSLDGQLSLWDKQSGELVSRIAQSVLHNSNSVMESHGLVAMDDEVAATSCRQMVTFWHLHHKALIHQVEISDSIDRLYRMDNRSVICQCANTMYRIDVPIVRIK